MWTKEYEYAEVDVDGDGDGDGDDVASGQSPAAALGSGARAWRRRRAAVLVTAGNVLLLLLSVGFFVLAPARRPDGRNGRNGLLKATSYYSPVLEQVEIPLVDKLLDGTLVEPDEGTMPLLLQSPRPAVDEAWQPGGQESYPLLALSAAEVRALGKDPAYAVKVPAEFRPAKFRGKKGDEDAYLGQMAVMHEVHCLNTLRKAAYFEYYFPGQQRTHLFNLHVNHCAHVLWQVLTCHADVDIVTYNWRAGQDYPYADMDIMHKCRDFGALMHWARAASVMDIESFDNMTRRDDDSTRVRPLPRSAAVAFELKPETITRAAPGSRDAVRSVVGWAVLPDDDMYDGEYVRR